MLRSISAWRRWLGLFAAAAAISGACFAADGDALPARVPVSRDLLAGTGLTGPWPRSAEVVVAYGAGTGPLGRRLPLPAIVPEATPEKLAPLPLVLPATGPVSPARARSSARHTLEDRYGW